MPHMLNQYAQYNYIHTVIYTVYTYNLQQKQKAKKKTKTKTTTQIK